MIDPCHEDKSGFEEWRKRRMRNTSLSKILQEQLDEYMVLSKATKHLGYKSRNSLEQFIAQGKLPHLTLTNGVRLFHLDDIEKLKLK